MRKLFWMYILLFPLSLWAQESGKTTVVFVCEHGGARSTIASVYFNKMAEEKHLPYRSVFRGLTPDSTITKETKQGLAADGLSTTSFLPVALSPKDIAPTTLLISLDCVVPTSYEIYQTWNGIPAISEDYATARKAIVKLLNELVDDLKNKNTSTKK